MITFADASMSVDDIVVNLQRSVLVKEREIGFNNMADRLVSAFKQKKGMWYICDDNSKRGENGRTPFYAFFVEDKTRDITGAFSGEYLDGKLNDVVNTAAMYCKNFLYPSTMNFAYEKAGRVVRYSGSLFLLCFGALWSSASNSFMPALVGTLVSLGVLVFPRSVFENYMSTAREKIVKSLGENAEQYAFGENARSVVYEAVRHRTLADTSMKHISP